MIQLVAICNERRIPFPLSDDVPEVTAGSLPDNAIYLPYKGISRRHFSLTKKGSGWLLQDLGSTNGVLLNGKKVSSQILKPGDVIETGAITIRVEPTSEEIQKINLPDDPRVLGNIPETDRLGQVELRAEGIPFSFPKLVLPPGMILGKSQAMMETYKKLHSIADSDISILFIGETGTGKDFLSNMVHLSSKRSGGPFIPVNCAALPSELVEAELFGIAEKAATNVNQRKGKIMAAEDGTLFLDELGSFPIALQPKILRSIEDKSVTPIGENRRIPVNFRVLSATNEDPQDLMRQGKLREDLYHRLAAIEIYIPPLRERKDDLEVLIPALLYQISTKESKRLTGISKRLLALLMSYSYPGNVRELINILKAMVALAHPGEVLDIHLVPEKLLGSGGGSVSDLMDATLQEGKFDLRTTVDEFTKRLILRVLDHHQGNVPKAAEQLNVTPFGLRKMMKRLSIEKD